MGAKHFSQISGDAHRAKEDAIKSLKKYRDTLTVKIECGELGEWVMDSHVNIREDVNKLIVALIQAK